ncbi:hypothetical protein AVEN_160183-1 [Araneus ventricosus]|uniref:Uncharacterized protein n=1 Tax=Araneus ventricosus TaxID=182803 RepID=A0A4Y2KYC6_ARAVE|nr:hypothetical protein AVEN_160183-1 [Araneus ventricosus]
MMKHTTGVLQIGKLKTGREFRNRSAVKITYSFGTTAVPKYSFEAGSLRSHKTHTTAKLPERKASEGSTIVRRICCLEMIHPQGSSMTAAVYFSGG